MNIIDELGQGLDVRIPLLIAVVIFVYGLILGLIREGFEKCKKRGMK
jgi:hypothetical protein